MATPTLFNRAITSVLSHHSNPDVEPLDPSMQRNIAAWLQQCDNVEGICSLLHLPHLDAEVDAMFADDRRAKVRAAWLSRPDRPVEDLNAVLSAERRETVLAAVGATPNLAEHIYYALIEQSKGIKPLMAILQSEAGENVKVDAAREISKRGRQLNSSEMSRFSRFLKDSNAARTEVLRHGTTLNLVVEAFRLASDEELVECNPRRLLETIALEPLRTLRLKVEAPGTTYASISYYDVRAIQSALSFAGRLIEACPELHECRADLDEVAGKLIEHPWPRHSAVDQTEVKAMLALIVDTPSLGNQTFEELRDMIYNGTAEQRDAALESLLQVKINDVVAPYMFALLGAAVGDGVLDDQLDRIMGTSWSHPRHLIPHLLERKPLPVEIALIAARHSGMAAQVVTALQASEDPRSALEEFITGLETPAPLLSKFLRDSDLMDENLLPLLPASIVFHSRGIGKTLRVNASKYVMQRLGDNPAAWQLFSELADGSSETLGGLLEMVDVSLAS